MRDVYIYKYIFISHRLGNGWCIKMIYPFRVGVIYPCFVGVITYTQFGLDLLRIRDCQRVHVVKVVGLKFVSFITLKIVLHKMH